MTLTPCKFGVPLINGPLYEDGSFVGYYAVSVGKYLLTFRSRVTPQKTPYFINTSVSSSDL